MKINFKKIIIHNFLSYGHSEIDLNNKGTCLVRGINRCPKDNAISNGSGKSTFISAICYALTGETIQGVTKDIKNIYVDENSCYVTLFFDVDNNSFEITRYSAPKSDLKIKVNGEDKSGKGIRESALILASYLPDLNKSLISSVILLGQGLPEKLSSYSPSGRKELLEKLTKTDFMIEDIKDRISDRLSTLNTSLRTYEDTLIKDETTLNFYKQSLESLTKEKEELDKQDFNSEIEKLKKYIEEYEEKLNEVRNPIDELDEEIRTSELNLKFSTKAKQNELEEDFKNYSTKRDELVTNRNNVYVTLSTLNKEIESIKNIKDKCPTCGRPYEGVVKPSTKEKEEERNRVLAQYNECDRLVKECDVKHQEAIQEINEYYKTCIDKYTSEIDSLKEKKDDCTQECIFIAGELDKYHSELIDIKARKESFDSNYKVILSKIETLNKQILELETKVKQSQEDKESTSRHIDVVKKMDTLAKRDFRGYLLSNVISFIDNKAKEYCQEVFGSNEINFSLDGNNIDISYCNKPFESLSGGEKQKVDLILQFTIRDLLSKYLNFSSNILCLDEIFDNLDSTSTKSVLHLIDNKLNDIESLFIISHHCDELDISYDCEMIVEKDENGISEVR